MMLKDKVVMVSGVGPGLGLEVARLAAREGAKVGIGCRTETFLNQCAEELRGMGADVVAHQCDISDERQCQAFASAALKRWGRIDALVNNAAVFMPFEAFENADFAAWRRNHDVNLMGNLQMARACLAGLKKAGGGYIVNVSSMGHKKPLPDQGAYASAKAGLEGATKQMALELGKYGIRVNVARMGWMDGPSVIDHMSRAAEEQGVTLEDMLAPIAKNIALGKVPDDADCAKGVLFLCTDWAAAISGAALDINGGEFMP